MTPKSGANTVQAHGQPPPLNASTVASFYYIESAHNLAVTGFAESARIWSRSSGNVPVALPSGFCFWSGSGMQGYNLASWRSHFLKTSISIS